jgi:hypothetical protein
MFGILKLRYKLLILSIMSIISLVYFGLNSLHAQTVYTRHDNALNGTVAGVAIPGVGYTGVFSVANPQWTPWIQVDTKRTVCYDIDLTDASAGITSIDMECYTDQVNTGAVTTGNRLPVLTGTSVTGISSSMPHTWRQTNNIGGAPGTSSWPWCVTNIPGAWIMCSFNANGVITAAVDTIGVDARGIVP